MTPELTTSDGAANAAILMVHLAARSLASALLAASSCQPTRRQFLSHGVLAAASVIAAAPAFAETPGDIAKRERDAAIQDPYGSLRSNQRLPFADELAPLSEAERRERIAFAQKAVDERRAAPQVSKLNGPAAPKMSSVSDEFTLEFEVGRPLGLELKDLRIGFEYGTTEGTSRVLVSRVVAGGQAAESGKVSVDNIVVAVNGVNVERDSARDIQRRLASDKAEGQGSTVTFKDALSFNAQLKSKGAVDSVSTTIAPGTDTSEAQVLGVRRLNVPSDCRRNAATGDLLEIRYAGRLADGQIFDGMKLADRFGDDSIQFVLGKQPAGQFPPSWDVGLQGMCVEERREIDVPPVLGFGPKGLVKKGVQLVPPNARIIYDVECVAINANAQH